jgi:hypothetical protein
MLTYNHGRPRSEVCDVECSFHRTHPATRGGGSGIPGRPDASIVNKGTITASSRGFAALVAPDARNSGTVTATLGTVPLAAGNSFTLDMYGDKLITLAVGDSIAAKVINVATGKRVPGGQRSAEPQQTGTTPSLTARSRYAKSRQRVTIR